MKKIFLILVVLILIPIIYLMAYHKENFIFSIGNNEGDISYIPKYSRITDIIIDIENNININDYKIQNLLVKSTTITVDINKYVNLKDYDSVMNEIKNLENLIVTIKKYTKEKIYIKLLEEKNILYEYANKKILLLIEKYDIMYVR